MLASMLTHQSYKTVKNEQAPLDHEFPKPKNFTSAPPTGKECVEPRSTADMAGGLVARGGRVAVVGAGAAGLAAARAARDGGYRTTVFESASQTGGTWNYGDPTQKSSMYPNLRCNIPKEIMRFRDFPFPESSRSFEGHEVVNRYLAAYAEEYAISGLTRFNTEVVRVAPDDEGTWSVTIKDKITTSPPVDHTFDAVVVANGHYSTPTTYTPPGTDGFTRSGERTVTHSHHYRTATPFVGRRVVVLGAGPSGMQIGFSLSASASGLHWKLPNRVCIAPEIGQEPTLRSRWQTQARTCF